MVQLVRYIITLLFIKKLCKKLGGPSIFLGIRAPRLPVVAPMGVDNLELYASGRRVDDDDMLSLIHI